METKEPLFQYLLSGLTHLQNDVAMKVFRNHIETILENDQQNQVKNYLKESVIDHILSFNKESTYSFKDFQSYFKIIRLLNRKS